MNVERRLLGNVAILGTGEFIAQFANFAFVVLIARAFGPEVLGSYSFSMAVSAIAVAFVSFGTVQLLTRNIGRDPDEGGKLLRTLFPFQILLAVFAWVGIVAAGSVSQLSTPEVGILAAIAGFQVVSRLTEILLAEPTGRQQMHVAAVVGAGLPILILGATSLLIWQNFGAVATLSVVPFCAFIFTLYAAFTATKLGGPIRMRWVASGFVAGLRDARPYFAIMLLSSAYERSGVIILGFFASREIVGEFAAGERIVAALGVLIGVVTTVALPALASLAASDRKRLIQVADRLIRVAWLIGLPITTVVSLFSADIIRLIFGESYAGSAAVLTIASGLIVIRALRAVLSPLAMATNRTRDLAFARATALIALICGAPFLVTRYGATGLASAMVLAEVILLTLLAIRLAAAGYLPTVVRPAFGIIGACGAASIVASFGVEWPLPQRLAATLLVGLLGLWVFRAVRAADIQFLMDLFRKEKQPDRSDI